MDSENNTQPTDDITHDIGGVQGSEPVDDDEGAGQPSPAAVQEEQAPDAGEIEWAGQVVKKPPAPSA